MRGKRLARVLKILSLLRGASSYNARRLAERLGTGRRNVYRDLAVLELAGVPYWYDPDFGDGGGYRIRQDWFFPQVGLSDQECLDLAVLSRAAESHHIPLLEDVATVRDKLLSTLPAKQQDLIRDASELFDILSLHVADHSHCRAAMTALQAALLKRKQVEGRYRSPHQKRAVRVSLQPRRVFLAGQAWYLAAYDNKDRQTKLFRVARFLDARVLTRPADPLPPFSLREMLGNAWTVYRGERDWFVEVRFGPEAADLVAETRWHHTQEVEKRTDGSLLFRVTVSGLEEIRWWVLGWGPRATVVKPRELAIEVQGLARRTLQNY